MSTSFDLSNYAPEFEIFVGKQPAPNRDLRASTFAVQTNETVKDVGQFTLEVSEKLDIVKQEFVWLDSPILEVGNNIRIDIGYVMTNLVKVMDGDITQISTSGFTSDVQKLTVVGLDHSHQYFMEKSTSENSIRPEKKETIDQIVERIAHEAGLIPVIDKTRDFPTIMTKKAITLNEFLWDLAKRVGYEFFVTRGKLFFINPESPEKKTSPSFIYEWGTNLMQFIPNLNATGVLSAVEVKGNIVGSKATTQVLAKADDNVRDGVITASQIALKLNNGKENIRTIEDRTFSSKEEAEDIAKAELLRSGRNLVTASATIVGNPKLMVGTTIEFRKVGKRFSGVYYVTGVTNSLGEGGYTTKVEVRRNDINQL